MNTVITQHKKTYLKYKQFPSCVMHTRRLLHLTPLTVHHDWGTFHCPAATSGIVAQSQTQDVPSLLSPRLQVKYIKMFFFVCLRSSSLKCKFVYETSNRRAARGERQFPLPVIT